VAKKARRESRGDHTLVRTWTEPLVAPRPDPGAVVVEVAPEPVVEVAPEPVVEVAPEPEPVVELAPEPFFDTPADPAPEFWPTRLPWEVRAKARIERVMATTVRHRRALITVCAVALALILLVAVPIVVRSRGNARWERCVERTTGTTLPRGAHVTQVVLDGCGPKPTSYRVPADRRN
jgi:hypothetical protein